MPPGFMANSATSWDSSRKPTPKSRRWSKTSLRSRTFCGRQSCVAGWGKCCWRIYCAKFCRPEHYSLQFRFREGTIVDAVIRLKEGMVPVDAKFPLENFRRMLEAATDDDRKAARKEFVRNVKKHIDDIHENYILTEEGTFPFALMYIPAENVYYETIIKGDEEDNDKALYAYATSKQVMPVSPNSFYMPISSDASAQGFRGLKIARARAMDIINHLNRLRQELDRFTEDFRKVGMHLTNAQTRFGEAEKRLTRFEEKLINAAGEPVPDELPPKIEAAPPPQP